MDDDLSEINRSNDSLMMSYDAEFNMPLKLDHTDMLGQVSMSKPRRKRQRKAEKPPKPPAEKKKRGRKSKMEKLMAQAAADAMHAGLVPPPGADWLGGNRSGVYMAGEMMNGPPSSHESILSNDIEVRRRSIDNPMMDREVGIEINL